MVVSRMHFFLREFRMQYAAISQADIPAVSIHFFKYGTSNLKHPFVGWNQKTSGIIQGQVVIDPIVIEGFQQGVPGVHISEKGKR